MTSQKESPSTPGKKDFDDQLRTALKPYDVKPTLTWFEKNKLLTGFLVYYAGDITAAVTGAFAEGEIETGFYTILQDTVAELPEPQRYISSGLLFYDSTVEELKQEIGFMNANEIKAEYARARIAMWADLSQQEGIMDHPDVSYFKDMNPHAVKRSTLRRIHDTEGCVPEQVRTMLDLYFGTPSAPGPLRIEDVAVQMGWHPKSVETLLIQTLRMTY